MNNLRMNKWHPWTGLNSDAYQETRQQLRRRLRRIAFAEITGENPKLPRYRRRIMGTNLGNARYRKMKGLPEIVRD